MPGGPTCARRAVRLAPTLAARRPVPRSVTVVRHPRAADARLLDPSESRRASLRILGPRTQVRLALGDRALDRGVLLGRYPRCAFSGVLGGDGISRVHALILRVGEGVFAFDTASTNGLYHDPAHEQDARVVALSDGERAHFGGDDAMVDLIR